MDQETSRPNDKDMPAEAAETEKVPVEQQKSETDLLRDEVETWRSKANEWKDSYARSLAEFQNYRKRIEREREQLTNNISADLLKKVFPAMDDLERALKSVPREFAEASWVAGVALILHKLEAMLREFRAVRIEAVGKPFDPNVHMAVTQGESDEFPAGTVMEELRGGYTLAGQVIRPTLVKVSTGPGPQGEAHAASAEEGS